MEDIYSEESCPFELDHGVVLREGTDVLLVACGEMVSPVLSAAEILERDGISACVIDMYCVKPLDTRLLLEKAAKVKAVITAEEHVRFGGLGSMAAQEIGAHDPKRVINLSLPDAPVITGNSREVFDYYGLNGEGIASEARKALGA